jgi:hypothetical protein|tara:strand:+ start:160 stop:336 length:177 start_codon:yes stop_codon:yes gene_type:complete
MYLNENPLLVGQEHRVIEGLGRFISEYKTTLRNAPPQLILGRSSLEPFKTNNINYGRI